MKCDEAKACFADDWCGMLRAPERDELKRHLKDCATCRQEAEGLESLWTKLDSLPAEEPSPQMRDRFYAALGAYGEGFSAASPRERQKTGFAWLPMGVAAAALLIGLGLGYAVSSQKGGRESTEIAQLRGEVNGMRELVALSLLRQQSASERLRGVSWANQVESSDGQVLDRAARLGKSRPECQRAPGRRRCVAHVREDIRRAHRNRKGDCSAIGSAGADRADRPGCGSEGFVLHHGVKAGGRKRFVKSQCSRKSGLGG